MDRRGKKRNRATKHNANAPAPATSIQPKLGRNSIDSYLSSYYLAKKSETGASATTSNILATTGMAIEGVSASAISPPKPIQGEAIICIDSPATMTRNENSTSTCTELDIIVGESAEFTEPGNKNKKKKCRQYFRPEWLTKFSWLKESAGKGYCRLCSTHLANNVSNIERHGQSERHAERETCLKNQPKIDLADKISDFTSRTNKLKIAELKIIVFLCIYNLPFTMIEPIIDLIKSIAVEFGAVIDLKCGRTKATETVNSILTEKCLDIFSDILKKNKFSLIIDETTDISTSKCLALVARYFDNTSGKIRDRFLNLIELDSSDSISIFDSIKIFFEKVKIPLNNLVGFAADNAATMMGSTKGVQALFKNINPHLYVIGCVCHSMNLCSSAASKAIPVEVEHLVRDIYYFFCNSSKRQQDFKEFQEYFDIKSHKLLKTSNTRWLSLQAAVQRVLEQWKALVHFFLITDFEQNKDIAAGIASRLNQKNKCYLHFLAYSLSTINYINLEFQSESPRFHVHLRSIKLYFKNVLNNFINLNLINLEAINQIDFSDNSIYKVLNEVYLGPKAELMILNGELNESEVGDIKHHCQEFYIILCKQILKRINFEDPVLRAVETLNPSSLGESLLKLIRLFPNLVKDDNIEELEAEWRLLILDDSLPKEESLEVFWHSVFCLENALGQIMYPHLKDFVGALLCLPHSSASTERVFSQTKLIKSVGRNKLKVSTVNSLMLVKEIVSPIGFKNWVPPKDVVLRYHKA